MLAFSVVLSVWAVSVFLSVLQKEHFSDKIVFMHFINTCGAGDFNRADLSLKVTPLVSKSGMECKIKDMYSIFNREWAGKGETAGLARMISWVQAAG